MKYNLSGCPPFEPLRDEAGQMLTPFDWVSELNPNAPPLRLVEISQPKVHLLNERPKEHYRVRIDEAKLEKERGPYMVGSLPDIPRVVDLDKCYIKEQVETFVIQRWHTSYEQGGILYGHFECFVSFAWVDCALPRPLKGWQDLVQGEITL